MNLLADLANTGTGARTRHGDSAGEGVGAIEGAVFGLMGLLWRFQIGASDQPLVEVRATMR